MKVITLTQFGAPDVLTLTERPKPTPRSNELLIRVRATTVGIGDLWARRFPLAQAAAAHRYMESGQRTGSVVITVS